MTNEFENLKKSYCDAMIKLANSLYLRADFIESSEDCETIMEHIISAHNNVVEYDELTKPFLSVLVMNEIINDLKDKISDAKTMSLDDLC